MNKKHKGKGHKKMYGGRTWDEYFRENKIASTALGALSGIAGFIPGVNMLVSPALGAASAASKSLRAWHRLREWLWLTGDRCGRCPSSQASPSAGDGRCPSQRAVPGERD